MSVIEVNHKSLRTVASAVNNYCSDQTAQMTVANAVVRTLLDAHWKGQDSVFFERRWKHVQDEKSTAERFKKTLKQFAKRLNACADVYQKAQEDAYNEANRLPKYFTW